MRLVKSVRNMGERDTKLSSWVKLTVSIVERVVLHMVEPPPVEPEECLRVFVVFSGMAGAWRNLRELDGRFFGGKKIVSAIEYKSADSSELHTLTRRSLIAETGMVPSYRPVRDDPLPVSICNTSFALFAR